MLTEQAYNTLLAALLPEVLSKYFELINVTEDVVKTKKDNTVGLHFFLEEKLCSPAGRDDLVPNGFYEEMCISDFPIRDKSVELHIRRRRWKDAEGKSFSNDFNLVAEGTRMSCELAAFLKGYLGHVSDYRPLFGVTVPHRR